MTIEIKRGSIVKFLDGDDTLEGSVNGDPYVFWSSDPSRVATYVPVYVRERDTTINVSTENVLEVQALDPVAS